MLPFNATSLMKKFECAFFNRHTVKIKPNQTAVYITYTEGIVWIMLVTVVLYMHLTMYAHLENRFYNVVMCAVNVSSTRI